MDSANGSAKARYDYKSYGRLEGDIDNPVASNAYTYTGREDDGTGLMYYRARYYDSELEVFISEDPLGDVQRYVGGNPLGFVDPEGLCGQLLDPGGGSGYMANPCGGGGGYDPKEQQMQELLQRAKELAPYALMGYIPSNG